MLLFAISGGIALLLILLFVAPTDLLVDYGYDRKVQALRLRVKIVGIPFSVKIPLEKKKKSEESQEKKSLTPKQFIAFSKSLYDAYTEVEDDCKTLLQEMKSRFTCQMLSFVIRYGTSNPARTGILNGAIWTAGSLLVKVMDSLLGIRQKKLEVYPDFNRAFISINLKVGFRFTAFNAARTVLKIIKLVNLIKSKIKTQDFDDGNFKKDGVE